MGEIIILAAIAAGTLINTLAIVSIKKAQTDLFRCYLILANVFEGIGRNQ